MAIEIGTNSYITLSEANDYMALLVNGGDWSLLDDTEKEKYVTNAFIEISNATYTTTDKAKAAQLRALRVVFLHYDEYNERKIQQLAGVKRIRNSETEEEFDAAMVGLDGTGDGSTGNGIINLIP